MLYFATFHDTTHMNSQTKSTTAINMYDLKTWGRMLLCRESMEIYVLPRQLREIFNYYPIPGRYR